MGETKYINKTKRINTVLLYPKQNENKADHKQTGFDAAASRRSPKNHGKQTWIPQATGNIATRSATSFYSSFFV